MNRYVINSIDIKKFRKLENIKLDIAQRITVIAGHNGIGKSTILGLIANASELSGHKSYFDKVFQSKFDEVFHLDADNDYKKTDDKYTTLLEYSNQNEPFYKFCTVTKHSSGKGTFRLKIVPRNALENGKQIGKAVNDIGESAKVPIPTLYVGMSRVMPIGELKKEHYTLQQSSKIDQQDIQYLNECFIKIIGKEKMDNDKVLRQDFKYSTKRSLGPNFKEYSYKSVSLGQDSLSTILTAIISFNKLKREMGADYRGGILVIDELDACLHPAAQVKLLEVLDTASKNLDLQVVVTSHSLTVIKEILSKKSITEQHQKNIIYYNVVYIMDTINPRLMEKPSYLKIKNDMFLKTTFKERKHQIKIYVEDEEACFFLETMLTRLNLETNDIELKIISAQINCDTLLKLPSKDTYFSSVIIVVDNDTTTKSTYREILESTPNTCALPGSGSPEQTIATYLQYLLDRKGHEFWDDNADTLTMQITRDNLLSDLEEKLAANNKKSREIYKQWFITYKSIFERTRLITYWMNDNSEGVVEFEKSLQDAINHMKTFLITNDA